MDAPLAGDNAQAKASVSAFIESLGLRPLDVGGLGMARSLEGAGLLGWTSQTTAWGTLTSPLASAPDNHHSRAKRGSSASGPSGRSHATSNVMKRGKVENMRLIALEEWFWHDKLPTDGTPFGRVPVEPEVVDGFRRRLAGCVCLECEIANQPLLRTSVVSSTR
jgi:hypothetical protein